jgi:hypothetical protein
MTTRATKSIVDAAAAAAAAAIAATAATAATAAIAATSGSVSASPPSPLTAQTRPIRTRNAPEHAGMVDTGTSHFAAALVRSSQAATQIASPSGAKKSNMSQRQPSGLSSLLSTQEVFSGKHSSHIPAAGLTYDDYDLSENEQGLANDEQEGDYDQEDLDDDEQAHSHKKSSLAAAAGKGSKQAVSSKKRFVWSDEGATQLCTSISAEVSSSGRLPTVLKTGVNAKVSPAWFRIAKGTPVMEGLDPVKAARTCSTKWGKIKSDTKVSAHQSSLLTRSIDILCAHHHSVCLYFLFRLVQLVCLNCFYLN